MRGKPEKQITMLSYLTPEELVPQDHPIRHIKPIVDKALGKLWLIFIRMYAGTYRPVVDTSRAPAQVVSVERALFDPQRALVLRTASMRPVVQVVSGPQYHGSRL
jgi:hypothetical protein